MTGPLDRLRRLAGAVMALGGWRRRGLAFLLGVLATGALAPYGQVYLLVPAVTGLLWLIAGSARARAAFSVAWWFGVGHCGTGFYWIAESLTVDPDRYAWLIPFSIVGFAVIFALYPAVAAWATWRLGARLSGGAGGRPGAGGVLIFAAVWTLLEWVRGWLFTGFPWNLVGTVWSVSDAMMQPASLVGVYGLTLVTMIAAGAPAALAGPGRRPWLPSAAACGVLACLFAYGTIRLAGAQATEEKGVTLRLVQPNIAQRDKWVADKRAGHVFRQRDMSMAAPAKGAPPPTAVIWAETAVPYALNRNPPLIALLAEAAPVGGALVTGALRVETPEGHDPLAYNSLYAIASSGRVADVYDKVHLVPLGEYVPFYDWLGFLKVTVGRGNFTPGPGLRVLDIPGLPPVTPLICYEAIFPGDVVPKDGPRPRWLLNITNDAWFGTSAGPYQHFAAARFRAVEEGLPLVRVANTGISAIVDPWGRVRKSLALGKAGVVDGGLPQALDGLPLFARLGNATALLLALFSLAFGAVLTRRGRPSEATEIGAAS